MYADYQDKPEKPVIERGAWIATSVGGMWSILDPHPADVNIIDIASGLSRVCRYGGQIRHDFEIYPVSEHSVLMLEWMESQGLVNSVEDGLRILLHDGSEAFFGDMTSPLKAVIPEFKVIEDRCQRVIDLAFGVYSAKLSYEIIKMIDVRIRMDEREALINEPALGEQKRAIWEHTPDMEGLDVTIRGLTPSMAREEFLETFLRICKTYEFRNPENSDLLAPHVEAAEDFLGHTSRCYFTPS